MKKTNLFLLFIFVGLNANAQLAMGKWRTHFAYNAINQITQSDNKVFAISDGSLFSIDKEDESMEFYSKTNGLNDANIVWIDYDKFNKQLIIIYQNGNIDLLGSAGILNIPDFYNKQLSVNKAVNHVCFAQDKAYLSCNFGIMVLNTKKNEIADSYYIGPNGSDIKVLSTQILDNKIYALTQNTLYVANANEPNLVNFEFWSTIQNLPGSGEFKKLNIFNNKLLLQRGNQLFTFTESEGWKNILNTIDVADVNVSNSKMIIYTSDQKINIVSQNNETKLIENIGEIKDAEYDEQSNVYWFAANAKGVLSTTTESTIQPKTYKPLGPAVNSPWSMAFSGEKLFVVPGGVWSAFYEKPGYVMIFDEKKPENEKWINLSHKKIEEKTGVICKDLVSIAVDPFDSNHYFATSYSSGLYEFRDTTLVKWHNSSNSGLKELGTDKMYHMTDGIKFDSIGNLWVLNSNSTEGVHVLKKDGKWVNFDYQVAKSLPNMKSIIISNQNQNQKWVNTSRYTPGLLIFDDKGTLDNISDDEKTFVSSFNDTDNEGAKISPSTFYCLAQDHNGVVWVGTEQGPLLFYNTSKVFDTDYTCSRVKIPRNDGTGLADYLLQSDRVKSIAIDGANRKWIGTENSGVYLMSENGQETIKHFTTANSPLISNDILSIVINPLSGEVFFGTASGIISYQSDASEANQTFGNVHAYPNPVRENYNGIITITGLLKDTQVKITDLNGNLICQTISNGALATWDGKNANGNKVSTGIYLVICVNQDGTENSITKIMVIN